MALLKITAIPQIYRNLNRTREIVSILIKYGLADWVSSVGLDMAKGLFKEPDGQLLAQHTRQTRIRLALSELGPTAIKLGQILSTRPDLVGVALADELEKLQSHAPETPAATIRETIEAELGQAVDELFVDFEDRPIASASMGQVHAARLEDGTRVAVKVQHPGIQKKVRVDLEIMSGLAQLAERVPEFANYRPRSTVAELQRTLLRELDFGSEERHLEDFGRIFAGDQTVNIPKAYSTLSTGRVLTMELLDGISLDETERLAAQEVDLRELARKGADLYMEMIFVHGYYHADPHPGNIVILPGNVIGLIDFGMVGRIDEQLREDMEELLLAIVQQDAAHVTSIITRLGQVPAGLDHGALARDVADFVTHYANQQIDQFDLSGALNEMTEMIHRYEIMLPSQIAMLLKVLVMLEGTSQRLNPRFNLTEVIAPYRRRMLVRRLSPARRLKKLSRLYGEFERFVEVLPRGLIDILKQVQSGKFDVHLDHRGLEPSVNRLVLGMLTSALFLGSSLLLAHNVRPVFNGVSVIGGVGCTASIVLFLRLLRAINKSGHLDRRD